MIQSVIIRGQHLTHRLIGLGWAWLSLFAIGLLAIYPLTIVVAIAGFAAVRLRTFKKPNPIPEISQPDASKSNVTIIPASRTELHVWSDEIWRVKVSATAIVYLYVNIEKKLMARKLRLSGKNALKHGPWVNLGNVEYQAGHVRKELEMDALKLARRLLHVKKGETGKVKLFETEPPSQIMPAKSASPSTYSEADTQNIVEVKPFHKGKKLRSTTGKLVCHRIGMHGEGDDSYSSYYADVETSDGSIVRMIGKDIERAVVCAEVKIGDMVSISEKGKTAVTVQEHGEFVQRFKNLWEIQKIQEK
ncbi:MAG: hypothetical protein KGI54_05780 [Pseudomonadota bacterium]|nr:hypothetical protein [Pseudomonadota bacterium]